MLNKRFTSTDGNSVIVRDLKGRIHLWDRGAEKIYGWRKNDAVGNVSHNLLETIFPSPLEEINSQLLTGRMWEGELIHTLSSGERVKVKSRWELQRDSDGAWKVIETNRAVSLVGPNTSFLADGRRKSRWLSGLLSPWFLLPLALVSLMIAFGVIFTEAHPPMLPLE